MTITAPAASSPVAAPARPRLESIDRCVSVRSESRWSVRSLFTSDVLPEFRMIVEDILRE